MTRRAGRGTDAQSGAARDSSSSRNLLRFDDLVDAFINEATCRDAPPELRDFHARRRQALAGLLDCDFDPIESEHCCGIPDGVPESAVMDRESAASIARSCLEDTGRLASPFGVRLAGVPGPIEQGITRRHRMGIDDACPVPRISPGSVPRNAPGPGRGMTA